MAIVVSDTSPIAALAHVGQLDLLPRLFQIVLIPPAVAAELASPSMAIKPLTPVELPFVEVRMPANLERVARLREQLDNGESQAIALAIELSAALLIDEAIGRRVATEHGIQITGALGVLVRGKKIGAVSAVAPLLLQLERGLDFYMSNSLKAAVLRAAGE